MLLQNCNGPNFFPAILILFYFFLTSMYGSWHTCVYECRLWDPCGNMLRSDGLYVYFHRKGLCLINVICARLRITHIVLCICLFVFDLRTLCNVNHVAGFSGLSILIFPLVNLLSFNKRNHTMLLQNFNGLNFFSCNFIYFHRKGWCLINVICG